MIPLPERDLERIQQNVLEGKPPRFAGDMKLYVGNIAFTCTEEDIYDAFSEAGTVGEVSLVRDEVGRIRGFGFVTMRSREDGERALQEMEGKDLQGRNLNVRESKNER
jgi:RNA recognition motif-containing protein